jgi:hypothetical protein
MNCSDLARQIEMLQPEAQPRDVARLCLLLANATKPLKELQSVDALCEAWRETSIRLQAASDQHSAMSSELEGLARSSPATLSDEQINTLLRAIRVQSQLLQLYLGPVANESAA